MEQKEGTVVFKKKFTEYTLVKYSSYFVVILIIAGIGWFAFLNTQQKNPDVVSQDQEVEIDEIYASEAIPEVPEGIDPYSYGLEEGSAVEQNPDGFIMFSALADGEETTHVFGLNLETGSISKIFPQLLYSAFLEPDFLNNRFFLNAINDADPSGDSARIYQFDISTGVKTLIESSMSSLEYDMTWSENSDLLAFSRLSSEVTPVYSSQLYLDSWKIIVTDVKDGSIVATIEDATSPNWSPDGDKILFLKNDGLYEYDIASRAQNKVYGVQDGAGLLDTSKFDISPDGKYIIWTTGTRGVVVVGEILSWNSPLDIKELGRFSHAGTEYYHPQFSPDGEMYVLQAIDLPNGDRGNRTNARFEVRSVLSKEVVGQFLIPDYDFGGLFTDTWIQNIPDFSAVIADSPQS